jgi:hypothetical protein
MATRIYAVQAPDSFRLVEASSKNAALRHVARDVIRVEVANQKTLVGAMQDGIKVERVSLEEATAE